MTAAARSQASFWDHYDVWLTPTLSQPPLPHGTIYTDDPDADRYLKRMIDYIPWTPIANVAGNPAMNVPLYWSAEGLPIGSHFMAEAGREDLLFSLAAQLEAAHPWSSRRPPVSAWAALACA
jgi:amidase